ncbi:MAG: TadE/TadG family type IV pilus assembly protein [Acidimicrobiales bacterium]
MRPSRHCGLGERGAATVEAALVLPLLVLFFSAIIDLGLALNDLQQVGHATFRAAREVAVDEYPLQGSCGTDPNGTDTTRTVCMLRQFSDSPTGVSYVKIVPPRTMTAGEQALVCLAVPARSITGVTQNFVDQMLLRSARWVRIESSDVELLPYEDTLPAGDDWSWCA